MKFFSFLNEREQHNKTTVQWLKKKLKNSHFIRFWTHTHTQKLKHKQQHWVTHIWLAKQKATTKPECWKSFCEFGWKKVKEIFFLHDASVFSSFYAEEKKFACFLVINILFHVTCVYVYVSLCSVSSHCNFDVSYVSRRCPLLCKRISMRSI